MGLCSVANEILLWLCVNNLWLIKLLKNKNEAKQLVELQPKKECRTDTLLFEGQLRNNVSNLHKLCAAQNSNA